MRRLVKSCLSHWTYSRPQSKSLIQKPEKSKLDGEYIFLQTVLDDLTDQGQGNSLSFARILLTAEPRLSTASLEAAITSRIALDESQTPFHYLLGAWKR